MKKIILILGIFCTCFQVAKAIVVQKLILKNGSELSGYIQKQDDKGNLTFLSDFATICLKASDVKNITGGTAYGIKELNKAWVDWAEKNDAFEGIDDNRKLTLFDIVIKDSSVTKVRILERGTQVKYLEMNPNTYYVPWKDVEAIRCHKREKTALSGMNRIYKLKSGAEYEGQYAGETNTTLSLYVDNGLIQTFNINEVIKYTFRPINPQQDIFEQSELLDVIRLKNQTEVKGIVIEQNYAGRTDADNYFLLKQQSGTIQSIKVSDIDEVRKEINSKYNPKFDILLSEGEIMVNRMKVSAVKVKEEEDLLVLDSINKNPIIAKGTNGSTKITVEYGSPTGAILEAFQLVKVTEVTIKKKPSVYSFSYKDLVNAVYRPVSLETSINNTTKVEYAIESIGIFALYDAKTKTAIPLIVK